MLISLGFRACKVLVCVWIADYSKCLYCMFYIFIKTLGYMCDHCFYANITAKGIIKLNKNCADSFIRFQVCIQGGFWWDAHKFRAVVYLVINNIFCFIMFYFSIGICVAKIVNSQFMSLLRWHRIMCI